MLLWVLPLLQAPQTNQELGSHFFFLLCSLPDDSISSANHIKATVDTKEFKRCSDFRKFCNPIKKYKCFPGHEFFWRVNQWNVFNNVGGLITIGNNALVYAYHVDWHINPKFFPDFECRSVGGQQKNQSSKEGVIRYGGRTFLLNLSKYHLDI